MMTQRRQLFLISAIILAVFHLLESATPACDEGANDGSCVSPEAAAAANDPKAAVLFIGDSGAFSSDLVSQNPSRDSLGEGDSLRLSGVYFDAPKRYVFKRAHFSAEDRRIFDGDTGLVVQASHHWGKNPYQTLDPLDVSGVSGSMGGEWKSATKVTSYHDDFPSLQIRPKTLSRHGTQYVAVDGAGIVMNVGQWSQLKSRSLVPVFFVSRGKDPAAVVYEVAGDLVGRQLSVRDSRTKELLATITKTNMALLQVAVFGSGSESIVDVAPGVDASAILAVVFALGQVGAHYVKDAFANFVGDPIRDRVVEAAFEVAGDAAAGAELGDVVADFTDDVAFGIDATGGLVDATKGLGDAAESAADGLMDVGAGLMDLLLSLLG